MKIHITIRTGAATELDTREVTDDLDKSSFSGVKGMEEDSDEGTKWGQCV